jgi:hypothetical protein
MCAAQTAAILAEDLGLGSVYVGTILTQLDSARSLLELPDGVLPIIVLSLGYPASRPSRIPKLPASAMRHDERYRARSDEDIVRTFEDKYGRIGGDPEEYFERAYVEVVEADKQHDQSWTRHAKARMRRLGIASNAQFLFELRYPQDAMVRLNAKLLDDLAAAGFRFEGLPAGPDSGDSDRDEQP